jgi:hypothetical protein
MGDLTPSNVLDVGALAVSDDPVHKVRVYRGWDPTTGRGGDPSGVGPGRPGRLLSPGSHRSGLALQGIRLVIS